MSGRRHIPGTVRQEIWAMSCAVCGSQRNVCIDHIVPVSKGGSSERNNLQPLCARCNGLKGNRLTNDGIRDYYRRVEGRVLP